MKGFDANKKLWNTNNFKSSIADRKGQNVICGKAKWRNVKYDTLCKKVAKKGQEVESRRSRGGVTKLYGIKGDCDHDMGIVSEGVGGNCRLYDMKNQQ